MAMIDIAFRASGDSIPADHCYYLLSAVSGEIPEIHNSPDWGIFSLNGTLVGNRMMKLNKQSRLKVRADHERLPILLKLAGKKLQVGEHFIRIGVPEIFPLKPAGRLMSRLVTIKGFMEPEPFLEAAERQLSRLGIKGKPQLARRKIRNTNDTTNIAPYIRRTLRIKDKEIVGYAVIVEELTTEESIRLQEKGIGGRRRMGCGLFVPLKGK